MRLEFTQKDLEDARERSRKDPKMWKICCVMNAASGHFLQTWLLLIHPGVSVQQFKRMSIEGHLIAEEFAEAVQKAIADRIPFDDYKTLRRLVG